MEPVLKPEREPALARLAAAADNWLINRAFSRSRARARLVREQDKSSKSAARIAAVRAAPNVTRRLTCAFLPAWIPARPCACRAKAKLPPTAGPADVALAHTPGQNLVYLYPAPRSLPPPL